MFQETTPPILQLEQLLKDARPPDTDLSSENPINLTVIQKTGTIFSSKVIIQEQNTSQVKPYEGISQKFEISHGTPKKINKAPFNKKLHTIEKSEKQKKYSLEFKQGSVSEICSGQSIEQVSRRYGLHCDSLETWTKKAYAPNLPYNSSEAWAFKDLSLK